MTAFELYNDIKNTLQKANIEAFAFEAYQLMEHFCGITKHSLLVNGDIKLDPLCEEAVELALHRRLCHEPLQYIIGEWEFFGRTYKVGDGVLIPRSDTETLVETAIEILKETDNPSVADLCSGSGCIGISIAKEIENSKVYAVELSEKAIPYLEQNAKSLGAENLLVVNADVTTYEPQVLFDLIASNPPYLTQNEMLELQSEVEYEPKMALVAKEEGLFFYRVISERYKKYLKIGGWLVFEVGYTQSEQVETILKNCGYKNIKTVKDLCGVNRVVLAQN